MGESNDLNALRANSRTPDSLRIVCGINLLGYLTSNNILAEKMGSPEWRPRSTAELLPDTVRRGRGAPQLYSHPTHWHARTLLRWVPVVRSIDPPGRKISGHRPNLMIATTTHPHESCVPIGNRELSRSFLRGGLHARPRYCDDKEGPHEGQEPRCPSTQIVRSAILYIGFILN
jgi:hypothetical protein